MTNKSTSSKTNLLFWGERTYVHSSNLFPEFVNFLDNSKFNKTKRLIMDFRSPVTTNGRYIVIDENVSMTYPVIAQAVFNDGRMIRFGLDVRGGEKIDRRWPDDEAELIQDGKINDKNLEAHILNYDPERSIGVLVALVKKLHLNCLPSNGFGQWLVGRLDVDMSVYKYFQGKPLSITLIQNMADSMTRTQAWLDNKPLAQVGFVRRRLSD